MAAFMYVAATIDTSNSVITGPEAVIMKNPTVIELYAKTEMSEVARRYRRLKSVNDQDTVIVAPVSEGYKIDRKSILIALSSQFSYASLIVFIVGSTPMLADSLYIESGLGMDDLSNILPDQYRPTIKRLSVNMAFDYDKYNSTT